VTTKIEKAQNLAMRKATAAMILIEILKDPEKIKKVGMYANRAKKAFELKKSYKKVPYKYHAYQRCPNKSGPKYQGSYGFW